MRQLILIIILLTSHPSFAQDAKEHYVVKADTTWPRTSIYSYVITATTGDTVAKLDSAKYYACFSYKFSHFTIVSVRNRIGWWAMDVHEHLLFRVFNAGYTEPDPDELVEGMIRIIGKNGKIGYANERGTVVIKPQFDNATVFHNGRALVYKKCKKHDFIDEYYSETCKENGYTDKYGSVIWLNISDEQMRNKLKWPPGL